MTTQQSEALQLDKRIHDVAYEMRQQATEAAAAIRRLRQSEREGWRHADELDQERRRLYALNQELLEALKDTHALLQATLLIINDAEARAIAKQQLDANRAAIARAEGRA